MSHDILTKRLISHDEAREIAQRLINSHFRQEPHARASIPAKPDYDDDLLISAYIEQRVRASARGRMIESAAIALLDDVRRRHPGEELYCKLMIALDRALSAPAAPVFDLISHIERQRDWSLKTFGPADRGVAGVIDHIRKELNEIIAAPTDLEEWVDVIILAIDGAHRAGHSPAAIADGIAAKQAKNEARQWPDWRTVEPGKAIEHVRDDDPLGR